MYTVSSIAPSIVPSAGTSVVLGDDQVSAAFPIGFTFTFMCNAYTNFYICSNGFISFNPAVSQGCCSGQVIPSAGNTVNNFVAWDWNDLYPPGAGTIQYQTIGISPNRICIITYSTIPHCCNAGPAFNTGQIKLFETSNIIEIHSGVITTDGSTATQGIMDQTGNVAYPVPGRNGVTWTATSDATRFAPSPALPACSVAPTPGQAVANPTVACLSLTTALSLTGTSGTCSATYQWQSALAPGGPYVNIAGATSPTAIATTTITQYYRCVLSCSGATAVSASATGSVTAGPCPTCAVNCTLYTQSSIPYAPSPNGGTSIALGDDVISGAVPIGFTFTYMCNAYTQMYIGSNGFVTFNPACSQGCCGGGVITSAGSIVNNFVAFLWTDLYPPGGGTITYQTIGIAPNRICVITYSNIPFYFAGGPVTGQIKLYETTNNIEVHSGAVAVDGHIDTQGIMDQSGTIGSAVAGRNSVSFSQVIPDATQWSYCNAALPLELTDYFVNYNKQYAEINWVTATEKNTSHFIIEKSADGFNYNFLAKIPAAVNSQEEKKYVAKDLNPDKNGVTYYRLKQFDIGSDVPQLNLIKTLVLKEENAQLIKIQPNPASSYLDVYLPESFLNKNVILQVIDFSGNKTLTISLNKFSSNPAYNLNVESLSKGLYSLRVLDENGSALKTTFIKN